MNILKEPPYNYDIEIELLSIMVNSPEYIPYVKKKIHKSMFYKSDNRNVYTMILYLQNKNVEINSIVLAEALIENFTDYREVALAIVGEIMNKGFSYQNLDIYINKIIEYSNRRKLIKTGIYLQENSNNLTVELNEILTKVTSAVDIVKNFTKEENDLADDIEDMSLHIGNKDATIPFGIPVLDRKISGVMRNDITTIGGRTGHGKTTFAIDTIRRQLDLGYRLLVLTNEVTKRLYLQKLACNIAGIEYQRVIKFGEVTEVDLEKFKEAKKYMIDNYVGKLNIYEFISNIHTVTSLIQQHKPDAFWFDWLQRLSMVPGDEDPKSWIKTAYGEIAKASANNNTASVIISQLSTRKSQARSSKRPELFDFDDSSFIEKASCDCHLIYWHYNDTLNKDWINIFELINAKNRFGEPTYSFLSHDPKPGIYRDSSFIPRERLIQYLKETGLSGNERS